jgi:hypothetical protein
MDDSPDVVRQRPVLATVLAVFVGALAYAGTSLAFRQTVDPLEVALFAVGFAAVYLLFALYGRSIERSLGLE